MTQEMQQEMSHEQLPETQPQKAMDFSKFGLPEKLMQSLARMEFTTPTPIQALAIPLGLKGKDLLGSAQTGTGKTGAFGIPLIAKLMESPDTTALVLTPTRELATQVMALLQQLIPVSTLKTALLIGGEAMPKQFRQLQARPRVIVGTPGRVNDHLERQTLRLNNTRFLVLDETDRMLDMGFGVQLDRIAEYLPKQRQTMMFSATLPQSIVKMSAKYLHNPERIAVGSTTTPAAKIKQENIKTNDADKYTHLMDQLATREGSVIIFVKTKHGADRMATRLVRDNIEADALHGDLKQSRRDRVIQTFRDKKFRVLVATDVAARGLDIPHIEHVINYDLPQCPEDYIHRIGRTARAGAEGSALNFLTNADGIKWKAIQKLINPGAKMDDMPEDRQSSNGPRKRYGNSNGKPNRFSRDRNAGGESRGYEKKKSSYSFGDSNGQERTYEKKKTFGDRPRFSDDRPRSDERKSFDDRPRTEERKSFGDRPRFEDRPRSDERKPFGDRPRSGDKPRFGDKPGFGKKPSFGGGKPAFGKKPFGGNKPFKRPAKAEAA